MTVLSVDQREQFWRDGVLTLPDAVSDSQLVALREQLQAWIDESRGHDVAWGALIDGRPRFDLAGGHSPDDPQLRRVNSPCEVSDAYRNVMRDSRMTDMVADLIGADTEVGWHQDFPFTPHTNDDLVTALLFLDDVTMENGALMVVAGSHLTGLRSLYRGDRFVAMVADDVAAAARHVAVPAIGPAGSVCLMHTALLHGSHANASARSRNLFITVYRAADAWPLAASPVPSSLMGTIVRGQPRRTARLMGGTVELPPDSAASSFFAIQQAGGAKP
jgi:hypothetical protein